MKRERRPFRTTPRPDEVFALDRRLFERPGAFGFDFEVPEVVEYQPDAVLPGGIAVLDLQGPVEHHSNWLFNSYEDLAKQVECALGDEDVRALVLKIDSPGGIAAGMGESHRNIRRIARATGKPIYAYVDEQACSAAYHIASACSEIWMPESAQVGSVGVILCTIDETAALDKQGMKVRYVVTGARKADFHPGSAVTDEVLNVAQQKIDYLGDLFFRAVGKARGMSADAVRGLEAAVYHGQEAVDVGLADGIASWPQFLLYVRTAISDTVAQTDAPAQGGAAPTAHNAHEERSMKKKLLQAARELETAKAALAKARGGVAEAEKAMTSAAEPAKKKLALSALEKALRAKIEAAALVEAKSRTVKHLKHEEKIVEEEDDEEEEERQGEEDADAESEEEEEEAQDSDAGSDVEKSEKSDTDDEGEEEEERAIARSYRAEGAGLYTPQRMLRLVRQVTGATSVKAAFGALDAMGQRLKAAAKLEKDVARLKAADRAARVDRILEQAKHEGRVVAKSHREALRADGMRQGTKWLKAHVAALPKLVRTTVEGEFEPRADADGNPIGGTAPSRDEQAIIAGLTAGLTPEAAEAAIADYRGRLAKNGKSHTPTH